MRRLRRIGLLAALAVGAGLAAADETPAPPRGLVVIDPGHGGGNAGAPGFRDGVYEKQVTMVLARKLQARLEAQGWRVELTRDRDVYVSLRERVAYANAAGADVFVSLHLNASPDHAQRGYETYVLTTRALDVDGRALRLGDGPERPGVDPATAALLDDVERGAVQPAAATLALRVQKELRKVRGRDGDRGVKQSDMHVLLGANMPAILVELGFIDHAIEGPELLDPLVQNALCDALAAAISGN